MNTLPKIKDIYGAVDVYKADALMTLMNQPPDKTWVKIHPTVSGWKYIPIERIEYLLKSIFKTNYKIEVLKTGMILNTVEVTVRVHYKDLITGEWLFHDGVGASEIQTQKGSGHLKLDMSNINRGAVTMALPIAKTLAVKDACDHFGKLFGSDLNRKDYIEYLPDLTLIPMDAKHANWNKVCEAVKSKLFTIEQIKEKYTLTDEAQSYLESL